MMMTLNSFYLNLIYIVFLTPVSSEEIIKVLNEFKPKKSRDHYGMDIVT